MKVQKSNGEVCAALVVPYTLDTNDMRFSLPQGFSQAEDFFIYLRDSFDALYAEGDRKQPEDDERGHALPPAGQARADCGAAKVFGPHCQARQGVGVQAH
jgi:hypothetical protein